MTDQPTPFFGPPKFFEQTAWYELGSGPPLLLIHGWPLHSGTWRQLAPKLAQHHRLVLVDLAGLGASGFDAHTDFRVEAHAARIQKLVRWVIPGKFGCIASDTGATIARVLAAEEPALDRLLMLNTEMPGHRPPWIRWYQAFFALPGGGAGLQLMGSLPWLLRSPVGFGGCFADPHLLEGDFDRLFIQPLRTSARKREGVMRYLRGIDWNTVDELRALHPKLACKVAMAWGAEDPTFPIALARQMTTQFATPAPLAEIPKARLFVHEEQPDAVAAVALPFFSA